MIHLSIWGIIWGFWFEEECFGQFTFLYRKETNINWHRYYKPYLTPPVHAPGSCCLAKWFPVDTGHASAMLGAMSTSLMFQGLFRKMTSFLGDLQPLLYLFKYKNEHICQQHSIQFSSVTQLCPTLCDPMDCSTPGLPVHHQLPEFTQTHVRWVGDAIQPSHPLSSPSLPAFNLSQHQGLF